MELERALGQAVRNTRTVMKLTQEELAKKADMQLNAISRVERAEGSASLRTITRIAKTLGVPVSELILQAEALAPGIQRTLSRMAGEEKKKRQQTHKATTGATKPTS
jgi:transcriptional regulator with XRE-family HTH domain